MQVFVLFIWQFKMLEWSYDDSQQALSTHWDQVRGVRNTSAALMKQACVENWSLPHHHQKNKKKTKPNLCQIDLENERFILSGIFTWIWNSSYHPKYQCFPSLDG